MNHNAVEIKSTVDAPKFDGKRPVAFEVDSIIDAEVSSILRQKNTQIKKLRDSLAVCRDSLSTIKDSLKAKGLEYDKLMENIDFADKCMMALAYRRCTEAYNRQSVERTLGYFDRLHE